MARFRLPRLLQSVLGLLFVVLIFGCGFLGWQWRIVKARQEVRQRFGQWTYFDDWTLFPAADVPWYRKLLGDQRVSIISFKEGRLTDGAFQEIRKTFPESHIGTDDGTIHPPLK